jgi:hypothetical protein
MSYNVGTAFVQIVPSFRGFAEACTKQMGAAGDTSGKVFTEAFQREVARAIGFKLGPSEAEALRQGQATGSRYADGLKARLDASHPQIKIDADTSKATAQLAKLDAEAKATGKGMQTSLVGAIAALAPAAVPLVAAAGGAIAGLIPVAATLALGIKGISDEMKDGSLAGTVYAKDLASIKSEGQQIERLAAGGLLSGIDTALVSSHGLFGEVNRDVSLMSGELGEIIGHAGPALLRILTAANPLLATFGHAVADGAVHLEDWAANSGGVEKFVAYVQSELPAVLRLGGELVTLFAHLAAGAAPFGGALLGDLNLFVGALDAIPVSVLREAIPLAVSLYAAFKAYQGVNAIVAGVSTAVAGMKTAWASANAGVIASEATAAAAVAKSEADKATAALASARTRQALVTGVSGALASEAEAAVAAAETEVEASAEKAAAAKAAATAATAAAEESTLSWTAALGPIGAVVAGGALLTTMFLHSGQSAQEAAAQINSYVDAIKADNGALADNTRLAAVKALQDAGALDQARQLGINLHTLTDAVLGQGDAYDKLNTQLKDIPFNDAVAAQMGKMNADVAHDRNMAADALVKTLDNQNSKVRDSVQIYQNEAAAMGQSTRVTDGLTNSTDKFTASLQKALTAVLALGQTELAQAQSEDAYKEGLLGLTQAVKQNGTSLSENTKGGLANRDALLQLLQQANAVAQAQQKNGKSTQGVTRDLIANVKQLENTAVSAGLSKDAVHKLVAQMKLTPKDIRSTFKSNAGTVLGEVATIQARLRQMTEQQYKVNIEAVVSGGYANLGSGIRAKATGGPITGPGTGTSDSILARVSNGEYIVRASQAAKHRQVLDAINYGAPGFASGGQISLGSATVISPSGSHGSAGAVLFGLGQELGQELISGLRSTLHALIVQTQSMVSSIESVAGQASASVARQIASAVAPAVTSVPGLSNLLTRDTTRATTATEQADIARQNVQALRQRANTLEDNAKAYQQVANQADRAALSAKKHADSVKADTNATDADKKAAEDHAAALQKQADKADNAAKRAKALADATVRLANTGSAAYQKLQQAEANWTQKAQQDAQALVAAYQDEVTQFLNTVADFQSTIASDFTQGGDIPSIWQQLTGTDANGNPILPTADQLEQGLQGFLGTAQNFQDELAQILAEGGSQSLVDQLASEGPVVGQQIAAEILAAGPDLVKQISATLGQISDLATTTGDDLAQQLYGAGAKSLDQLGLGLLDEFPALKKALKPIIDEIRKEFTFTPVITAPDTSALTGIVASTGTNKTHHGTSGKNGTVYIPYTVPAFASGVENFEGGLAVVHRNELLVNLSKGTSVYPQITTPTPALSTQTLAQVASTPSIGKVTVGVQIGNEAIDPHMVKVTNVVIDRWQAGAQHVAPAAAKPALNALGSPHATAACRT